MRKGQYIKNASIHDTYNRCVTVHGTNDLRVENNVTYNAVGHCFFLEDGIEHGNEFVKNLAIQIKCHTSKPCVPTNLAANGERCKPRHRAISWPPCQGEWPASPQGRAAAFGQHRWRLTGSPIRTTASSTMWPPVPTRTASGFPCRCTRKARSWTRTSARNTWPRRTPLRAFRGNVAHSNFDGFMFDRHINEDNTFGTGLHPVAAVGESCNDLESEVLETHFENLTSYKNRNGGLWGRGDLYVYSNVKFADNAIGMTQAAGDIGSSRFHSRLVDSLVVGETDNIGNPTTPEEMAYGRSLPKPPIPDFPIRGYEYYDYRDEVVNTTFVNYQDNDAAKNRRAFLPAVHERGAQYRKHHQRCEIRQRQAGVFPEDRSQVR